MPERRIVFDTTVLSNFLIASAVPLLLERYKGRGVIVGEVYDELCAGMRKRAALREAEKLLNYDRFALVALSKKDRAFYVTLLDSLGKGESASIAYARYARCTVASDDRAARKACERYSIPCTGTVGILIASCRDGQISGAAADAMLRKMVDAGFYSPIGKISDML